MNPELTAQLYERYPLIFARRPPLNCGDGWFDLLDKLCSSLHNETTQNGALQVIASQVREKFGGLRFGAGPANERQRGMIDMAEAISSRICEVCGHRGKTIGPAWFRTRCEAHAHSEIPYDDASLGRPVTPMPGRGTH
ncbi:hypothetical protein LMG27952_02620 [Paraburkholderia hiiakae]|uniref:Uncharacterized protein n=1 Tax=Paraburkholderia hiiakae TaxID=1081782 RepID=A0ABN7HUA7_9BURK|nr:hypothetical protein [Paraburkholderia hiiakae]CAD6531771.1 hypothetical protein LMG27952_02620 [Paraburkholderia hiiakae]